MLGAKGLQTSSGRRMRGTEAQVGHPVGCQPTNVARSLEWMDRTMQEVDEGVLGLVTMGGAPQPQGFSVPLVLSFAGLARTQH